MKITRCRNKLTNIPIIILNNGETIKDIELSLFSNFFVIGINDSFFNYPDCDILLLDNKKIIKENYNVISGLRCIKYCPGVNDTKLNNLEINILKNTEGNLKYNYRRQIYDNKCIQDLAVQLSVFLGCSPIITAGFDSKNKRKNKKEHSTISNRCEKCMVRHSKNLKNVIFSMTPNDHIPYVDPFGVHSKYNDCCPDRLDLLKRLF
jgi:hypothetical protein